MGPISTRAAQPLGLWAMSLSTCLVTAPLGSGVRRKRNPSPHVCSGALGKESCQPGLSAAPWPRGLWAHRTRRPGFLGPSAAPSHLPVPLPHTASAPRSPPLTAVVTNLLGMLKLSSPSRLSLVNCNFFPCGILFAFLYNIYYALLTDMQ